MTISSQELNVSSYSANRKLTNQLANSSDIVFTYTVPSEFTADTY